MIFRDVEHHFCGRSQDYTTVYTALGKKNVSLLALTQVHGNQIHTLDDASKMQPFLRNPRPEGDGYITNQKNAALSIYTADCLPIVATDGVWVGICHVGWKGMEKNIIEKFVEAFQDVGVVKDRLNVYIGPGIDYKCFEVHNDVAQRLSFIGKKPIIDNELKKIILPHRDQAKKFVNLRELAFHRFTQERVKEKSIIMSTDCTYEKRDFYHSFRRDGNQCGQNISFVYKV